MDAKAERPPRWRSNRLIGALGAVAFAPIQAAYLISLLGLVAALAAFRAFGPFKRRTVGAVAPAPR